jgi:hypothetical protein
VDETSRSSFLLIGSDDRDFSVNRLKVAGIPYRRKSLYSRPENWEKIIQLLEDPNLTAVIGKLGSNNFKTIATPEYANVATRLFEALGKKPHLLLSHTAVLEGTDELPVSAEIAELLTQEQDDEAHEEYIAYLRASFLAPPTEAVRQSVLAILNDKNVSITPYNTNAEAATLAGSFIDDYENNLLFRIYVPTGRLYAAEADRLLALFHDWLTQVGRHSVRQDGYSTAAGRVYEFFGDQELQPQEMSRQFSDFSSFLDLCATNPDAAEDELSSRGLARSSASNIVTRYGRSVRRINTDLRHERESRMLAIRHRMESELLDISEGGNASSRDVDSLIDALTPQASTLSPLQTFSTSTPPQISSGATVTINQQIFHNLQGAVMQNVHGTVHLGMEAKELLRLIENHAADDASTLESAVHELEDPDARQADRLSAKARLSAFLVRLRDTAESAGLAALQKYLESKLGL